MLPDGDKFQVKLSSRATAWVRYLSRLRNISQSDLIREMFEERLFLFQLPLSVHQRMQARANELGITLQALVVEILHDAAMKFTTAGGDLLVPGHKTPDEEEGPITRSKGFAPRPK